MFTSKPDSFDGHKHGPKDTQVVDLLLRRWSPRAFAATPVSDADLRTIFNAGIWAASSFNEQPWRFVLGRNRDAVWNQIFEAIVPGNQGWAEAAPVLYASFAKTTFARNGKPNSESRHDVGAASANISLQATALGLHTHGMAGFDADVLRSNFVVPEGFDPVACWALGYLGDPESLPDNLKQMELASRERKAIEEVVFGKWGQPIFL